MIPVRPGDFLAMAMRPTKTTKSSSASSPSLKRMSLRSSATVVALMATRTSASAPSEEKSSDPLSGETSSIHAKR